MEERKESDKKKVELWNLIESYLPDISDSIRWGSMDSLVEQIIDVFDKKDNFNKCTCGNNGTPWMICKLPFCRHCQGIVLNQIVKIKFDLQQYEKISGIIEDMILHRKYEE